MKKTTIVAAMLVLAVFAVAQSTSNPTAPPAGAAGAQSQSPAAPGQTTATGAATQSGQPPAAQQKTIKDPAEYNAYLNVLNQANPTAKATALEAFLQTYPNSVVKTDALELLMATYQQANQPAKVTEAAQRLLQVDPNNLRALALMTYNLRASAENATNPQQGQQLLMQAAPYAQRGLQALTTAPNPEGVSDAQWQKVKTGMAAIFNGTLGQAELQQKNYASAQQHLRAAVNADPKSVANIYPLALSYLQAQPPDYVNGLWYLARAVDLAAGTPAQAQIANVGKAFYRKYHGGYDGWDQLLQQAANTPDPPPGFSIAPAPSPAELAAKIVQSKPTSQMSFDEIQLVLTNGAPQDAAKVWNDLKQKPIALQAKLISSTPTQLQLAASAEDIDQNKADVTVTMAGAIPPRLEPRNGALVEFQGTPVSYTTNPFNVVMTNGMLITKTAPAPKKPARRRAPSQ